MSFGLKIKKCKVCLQDKDINCFAINAIKNDELKTHLENQFESWVTWSNHGKYLVKMWDNNDSITWTWQIDHIIPQSDLPYTSMEDDNFKTCWALKNLRPLRSDKNHKDGITRIRHGVKNVI